MWGGLVFNEISPPQHNKMIPTNEINEFDWTRCQCDQCSDSGINFEEQQFAVSLKPTPYAVRCYIHGRVFLSHHEYNRQMNYANAGWVCPLCPEWQIGTSFDDDIHERAMELEEDRLFKLEQLGVTKGLNDDPTLYPRPLD